MEDKVFDNRVFVYGTLQGTNPQRGLNMFPGAVKVGNATTTDGIFTVSYTHMTLPTSPHV